MSNTNRPISKKSPPREGWGDISVNRMHFFPGAVGGGGGGGGGGNRRRSMLRIISTLSHYLTKCSKNGRASVWKEIGPVCICKAFLCIEMYVLTSYLTTAMNAK